MGKKHRRSRRRDLTPEQLQRKRRQNIGRSVAALCIAGMASTAATVGMAAFTTGYTVEYEGIPVAYVENRDAISTAVLQAESLTSDLLHRDYSLGQEISAKAAIVPRASVTPQAEAADSIMEQIPELTRAYTLTVDGTYIGAAESADTITQALEKVKDVYRTPETISVFLESQVNLDYQFLPAGTQLTDADTMAEKLLQQSLQTFSYTTQAGDTMSSVAERFSMSPERLAELNADRELEVEATDADIAELSEIIGDGQVSASAAEQEAPSDAVSEEAEESDEEDAQAEDVSQDADVQTDDILPEDAALPDDELLAAQALRTAQAAVDAAAVVQQSPEDLELTEAPLKAGQELTVEQTCSLLVVSTVEEEVSDREVLPEKMTLLDNTLPMGQEQILIEGVPGQDSVLSRVTKRCGVPVSALDLNSVTRKEAAPLLVAVGYGSHPELFDFYDLDGFMFRWPVQGRISSDYGYRYIFGGINFHRGVDIPAPSGTAVHAGSGGVVLFAGEKGSYGNLVIIDHGNGFQSYYGHNSRLLVKAGDLVSQGQIIAAVGSTGRSTGPHCHFEVHYNGELVDPLMYLPGDNNAPIRSQAPLPAFDEPDASSSASASDDSGGGNASSGSGGSAASSASSSSSGGSSYQPAESEEPEAFLQEEDMDPAAVNAPVVPEEDVSLNTETTDPVVDNSPVVPQDSYESAPAAPVAPEPAPAVQETPAPAAEPAEPTE